MILPLKKATQFNATMFGGNFLVNKPVMRGNNRHVQPYSNLFYWSHAIALDDCEFPLHPHEGFEIMTFILEGNVSHFDTTTNVWTPLKTGDFQIIQSNSGVEHQEKIAKGTRSFQIWFDPNFYSAIQQEPSYMDYHSTDFQPTMQQGINTIEYVGGESKSFALTPHLGIKRLLLEPKSVHTLTLDKSSSYMFYLLKGNGALAGHVLQENDALRVSGEEVLQIEFEEVGDLFFIQTPSQPDYRAVWL